MEWVFLTGGDLLRQRAGCGSGFGEEDSAHRVATEHDAKADECGDGIVHQDHQVDGQASDEKHDGSGGKPPVAHRMRHTEQRRHREREKADGRKDDERQDAVERSEAEHEQSQYGLQKNSVGGCAEAWMQLAEWREEGAVLCHGVVDAGSSHRQCHQAAEDGEQHTGR
jgi:hypothetical protein